MGKRSREKMTGLSQKERTRQRKGNIPRPKRTRYRDNTIHLTTPFFTIPPSWLQDAPSIPIEDTSDQTQDLTVKPPERDEK